MKSIFIIVGCFIVWMTNLNGQHFMPVEFSGQFTGNKAKKDIMLSSMTIPFHDKIQLPSYVPEQFENAEWTISGENEFYVTGFGIENLEQVLFNIPGQYRIDITKQHEKISGHTEGCGLETFPEAITLNVLPYKITFLKETFTLSDTIRSGEPTDGITLSIDVLFESFNGETLLYGSPVNSAGIQTTISGFLPQAVDLQPGIQTLNFSLTGVLSAPQTYISFDFDCQLNSNFWSYPLMNPIY